MIFPVVDCEREVQTGDKTRLLGVKSFVSRDEGPITKVEICPDYTALTTDWFNVSGRTESDWYLDWVYKGATRTVVAGVRVTVGTVSQTALKSILILDPETDALFSTDDDLLALEPSLNRYPPGRSSFINVAREAKAKILEALSDKGIRNADGSPLTAAVLKDVSEVRTWSRDLTLQLIFQGGSNSADDVFFAKAKYYQAQVEQRAARAFLSLTIPVQSGDQPYRSGQVQTMSLIR